MKCETIQDIILTDYLDGRLTNDQEIQLDRHLERCPHCREFVSVCRQQVIEPFQKVEPLSPPEEIWAGIKDIIQGEPVWTPRKNTFLTELAQGLNGLMGVFKPVFFPFAMSVIILGIFMVVKSTDFTQSTAGINKEEPVDYLVSILNDSDDGDDYGVYIEEYFL